MMWIVLTVAVLVCGILLFCVYVLSKRICSLKEQVREFAFMSYAEIIFISAKTGQRVE